MAKYHINPETGNSSQCRALIKCRFGSADDHYGSEAEARAAFEKVMADQQTEAIILPANELVHLRRLAPEIEVDDFSPRLAEKINSAQAGRPLELSKAERVFLLNHIGQLMDLDLEDWQEARDEAAIISYEENRDLCRLLIFEGYRGSYFSDSGF